MDEEDGCNNNENQRDDFMAQLSFMKNLEYIAFFNGDGKPIITPFFFLFFFLAKLVKTKKLCK
jgi:hypothetical protein